MVIHDTTKMRDIITLARLVHPREFLRKLREDAHAQYRNGVVSPKIAVLYRSLSFQKIFNKPPHRSFDALLDNDLETTVIAFGAAAAVFGLDADDMRAIAGRGL